MTNHFRIEKLEERLAFLQVRIDENVATDNEIRYYNHVKAQVRRYEKQRLHQHQSRKVRYQHVRKYNDGICWNGGYNP